MVVALAGLALPGRADAATTWTWFNGPNPSSGNVLNSVSCISPTRCRAVGSPFVPGPVDPLVLRTTDGKGWSVVPSPNPAPSRSASSLFDVSCANRTDCTAVGSVYPAPGSLERSFILRTANGTDWSRSATPIEPQHNSLVAVSCVNASSCTAVDNLWGDSESSLRSAGLRIATGDSWFRLGPSVERSDWSAHGVDCPAPNACVVVGTYSRADPNRTIVLILRES